MLVTTGRGLGFIKKGTTSYFVLIILSIYEDLRLKEVVGGFVIRCVGCLCRRLISYLVQYDIFT